MYRIAMRKDFVAEGEEKRADGEGLKERDVWEGVPIEYARIQTESPPREGWNHGWTR